MGRNKNGWSKNSKRTRKKGWSQNDLAKLLQVSRQTISKWETESAYLDVERLMQLSDLFEISLDALIRDREVPAKKLRVQRARTGMTFWDFLSKRWWLIFIFCVVFSVVASHRHNLNPVLGLPKRNTLEADYI